MVKNIILFLFYGKKLKFKSSGKNLIIKNNCKIFGRKNITLGNNVYIGQEAYWTGAGGIEIQDNVMIGPYSRILSYNHNYNSTEYLPYDNKEILKKVTIEQNSWIGIGVFISPGVTIGEGAIVAMGSVVVKNVEPLTIVGGNPAKKIGERNSEIYEKLKKEGKFYFEAKLEGKIIKEYIQK